MPLLSSEASGVQKWILVEGNSTLTIEIPLEKFINPLPPFILSKLVVLLNRV